MPIPGCFVASRFWKKFSRCWSHEPKNGRWNAEQPLVSGTVEAFAPGNVEA